MFHLVYFLYIEAKVVILSGNLNSNNHQEKLIVANQSTSESVALILWSKTLLKTVKDQVSIENIEEEALLKRIRRKWSSMSPTFQSCWLQAAKALLDIPVA